MITHIQGINESIQHLLNSWHEGAFDLKAYELAESVAIRDESGVTFPAYILPTGECLDVYSETDKHDVTLYHRLNDISFQEVTNQSFGSHKKYQEVDDLSLIVFGKRAAIDQFTMERIARKAIASIDARTVVRSDFNALQVFANEYLGVTYFLTPEYYMFKINYRITSTYDDRCATIV